MRSDVNESKRGCDDCHSRGAHASDPVFCFSSFRSWCRCCFSIPSLVSSGSRRPPNLSAWFFLGFLDHRFRRAAGAYGAERLSQVAPRPHDDHRCRRPACASRSVACGKHERWRRLRRTTSWMSTTPGRRSSAAQAGGVTIKTRQGLTTFAQGLDDREMRYLQYVVRQALIHGQIRKL